MHALGCAHLEAPALFGQRLNLIGPDPGRVDHDVAANLGNRAVLGVADAHADHPVTLSQQGHYLGGAADNRAVMRRGARDRHGVPGVVDDGVVVTDTTDQRAALRRGSVAAHRRE